MEFKKDYFPTARAPDIAKKKVMQYIYGSQKNLSKRFYFYRVYAPAFLLFFIVIGGLAFYNRELKSINRIQEKSLAGEQYNENQELIAKSDAMRNFVENNGVDTEDSNIEETNIQNTNQVGIPEENIPVVGNIDNKMLTVGTSNDGSLIAAKNNNLNPENSVSTASPASSNAGLDQQISEIENLMNDITSITSDEEALF